MIKLSAKPAVESIHGELKERVKIFAAKNRRTPKLVVVLVGNDPASVIYTQKKGETAVALGMRHESLKFPASAKPEQVRFEIERLNADPDVDGILIQRPLPSSFPSDESLSWVHPSKDVDCFHPQNVGLLTLGLSGLRSCTPLGVMKLLEHYQISPAKKIACVIGRSAIVGKPMASLLLHADATVLQCHSKTPDMRKLTLQADLLVVAAGKPKMIDASFVKKGAVVVDVGIHRTAEGKVCGDVDFDAVSPLASALTPVPGGVGPMTIAMLMSNTVQAAEMRVHSA